MYFFRLVLWAICLIGAWIGSGGLTARLLGLRERSWGLNGVLGISLFVLLGGFLNLARLVLPLPLISLVVFGDLLFVAFFLTGPSISKTLRSLFDSLQTWGRMFAALCGAGLLTAAIHGLSFTRFNFSDDLPAYLTFPVKLIQLGSLGFDPFSERRVQSGLGASFFLQACMLVAGDVRSLWFPDAGAGLIFFAGCVYAAGRRLGNAPAFAMALASLVVLVPSSHMNLGMSVLPAAIFVAFFLVETAVKTSSVQRSIILGLLAATVTMLKSTYLPPSILIIAFLHLARVRRQPWSHIVRDFLASSAAYVVPLLPWMIDMKRKEGTFLYPLLGKGYEISAYGAIPHMIRIGLYPWALGSAVLALIVGAAIIHWILTRQRDYTDQVTAILLACGLCILPLSVSVAGAALLRYISPFVMSCSLLFLGSLLPLAKTGTPRPRLLPAGYVYAAGILLVLQAYGLTHGHYELFLPDRVRENPIFRVDLAAEQIQASRVQAALPSGESLYASLMVTYPMDFRRNQVFVADFPGMASLPPGMPTQNAPQALRSYLLANHIRYVAYSAKFRDLLLTDSGGWILSPSKAWPRMQLQNSTDVDHELEALAPESRTVFDDGDVRVLDLEN